ncbi:hypothetical protein OPT61_g5737 [Boeremia exigua]|uniref:Uncharacterized protein n=1 Tax=Boeremia exigua TaxID=749465 RepID=A0ACC2I997_9PLEO|nr:hypothetical protein OPT61_g5737 [Boeremia exigua]
MYSRSRTYRDHFDRNGWSSYRGDHHFMDDGNFNSIRRDRYTFRREPDEGYRRTRDRFEDPYSMPRQRTGVNHLGRNSYARDDIDHSERRRARRHSDVDHLTSGFADLNMGAGHSHRSRPLRRVSRRNEDVPAPEPPLFSPRNVDYHLNRAYRDHNTAEDNYNDAYQYIHGRQPAHGRQPPERSHRDPENRRSDYEGGRLRFGTDWSLQCDPGQSFRDRFRHWF